MQFLKKKNVPYMITGRWYKFFCENDVAGYKLTTSDLPGVEVDNANMCISMPAGYHVVDHICDPHIVTEEGAIYSYAPMLYFMENKQCVSIPDSGVDYFTMWIFAYKE